MVNLSQDTALKIYNKFWKPQHLKSFSNQSVANII
jgi:hypothetical protein